MKLKAIPQNTVVHTPTEAEAKELLAILHENGYKWCGGSSLIEDSEWEGYQEWTCYWISSYVGIDNIHECNGGKIKPLTLVEFKAKYCEEEKPKPRLHLGERVRIVSSGEEDFINMITEDDCYELLEHRGRYTESDLAPYIEPEPKPTEDMETKELNLCELLKGHEGKEFFSLAYGVVVLEEIRRGTQIGDSPDFLCVRATSFDSGTIIVNPNGKLRNAGVVDLVPSRALYEQYPLDPYTAWMKWQEEQRTYEINISIDYCENFMGVVDATTLTFRTPTDRDKCIKEIKAIIEKYSKV